MRTMKLKSGGSVNVYPDGMEWAKEGPCFSESELAHGFHVSNGMRSDPEMQREFWKTCLEKKVERSTYSLFEDFPAENLSEKARMARKYCGPILEMLRGRKPAE